MASKRTKGAGELKRVLKERGLRQSDIRRACGAPAGMVPRWLSGERGVDLKNALILQELYSIPAEMWLDSEERKKLESVRQLNSATQDTGC